MEGMINGEIKHQMLDDLLRASVLILDPSDVKAEKKDQEMEEENKGEVMEHVETSNGNY